MKRSSLLNIHLYCASFSAIILVVFAFSGGMHLLNFKELETSIVVETLVENDFLKKEVVDENIANYLKEKDKAYHYEYIKSYKGYSITRPTTRDYYKFEDNTEGGITVIKMEPSLRKRLFEFHKGHGRKFSRWINSFFGLCLMITVASGIWLGLKNKRIRTATIVTTLVSFFVFLIEFYS
ncbi:MAG: hypothetical protein CES88_02555 [Halobacteriovorax sp. JY17]|nr:MAG: hypothetical protein CES88_02555 [Halobacteriovorax sp. JY17]